MKKTVAVIGAGAWGTTLSLVLAHQGHEVRLWEYFQDYARVLQATRENPKFLPGVVLPESILITSDMENACLGAQVVVMVCPAQVMSTVAKRLVQAGADPALVISASKGIENESLLRMSEILQGAFSARTVVGVLSGPSHAEEVSRRLPCSVVAAAAEPKSALEIQDLFMTPWLRVYTSPDVIGVELGGALKNVIAIAAGVVDGLGLGDNAKAALVTRGLAEIQRLGKAAGAQAQTFAGLSGLGDLVVTCMSQHSRNRRVGEELGRGRTLAEVLKNMEMVAEGVETCRSASRLAERFSVEAPIIRQVHSLLFEGVEPAAAVAALMQRTRKSEMETTANLG